MTRNKLYLIIALGLIAGYSWLAYIMLQGHSEHNHTPACLFKNTTGVPCPSCGNTRSIIALTEGNISEALLINPLGIIVASIMLIFPLWLLYDVSLKKDTLYKNYLKFEKTIKTKHLAIVLVVLVIINWIWNIQKGL
ncbi:DUF2752 domain-containing protein [Flavobacterium litorale]|uniref:DUF2752 domain-containing protein n=1 Tax=Flavobacterium litorale TaxID=2856519 RepID=A0ABX8VB26_9FLAO|nr:DUF2752 domain-containing protein [Flavobacterium litorale]QYJ67826.1 DUF2752 domain-containing protein [Flavobacterium litorale]